MYIQLTDLYTVDVLLILSSFKREPPSYQGIQVILKIKKIRALF